MAARVEDVAAGIVERQAEAEGAALAHLGDALQHLLAGEELSRPSWSSGPKSPQVEPGGRCVQRGFLGGVMVIAAPPEIGSGASPIGAPLSSVMMHRNATSRHAPCVPPRRTGEVLGIDSPFISAAMSLGTASHEPDRDQKQDDVNGEEMNRSQQQPRASRSSAPDGRRHRGIRFQRPDSGTPPTPPPAHPSSSPIRP